jgi:hypothetical protein
MYLYQLASVGVLQQALPQARRQQIQQLFHVILNQHLLGLCNVNVCKAKKYTVVRYCT